MKCSKCGNYSFPLRRCVLGKVKPPSVKGGVDAARFMGLEYICSIDAENAQLKAKVMEKLRKELSNEE